MFGLLTGGDILLQSLGTIPARALGCADWLSALQLGCCFPPFLGSSNWWHGLNSLFNHRGSSDWDAMKSWYWKKRTNMVKLPLELDIPYLHVQHSLTVYLDPLHCTAGWAENWLPAGCRWASCPCTDSIVGDMQQRSRQEMTKITLSGQKLENDLLHAHTYN